ncbi:MAG: alpha/beta fold hydrolase [Acidimicrobiales bacterium]
MPARCYSGSSSPSSPLVLVHGGFLGGWIWTDVKARLEVLGHRVVTPTLLGLGERAAEATPETDVEMQADDLASTVEAWGEPVALLGHSYAGMVVTALADRQPELVGRLLLLDAFAPTSGECLLDLLEPEEAAATRHAIDANGGFQPPPDPDRWHIDDAAMRRTLVERLTPQPGRTVTKPISLDGPFTGRCDYISMTRNQKQHFRQVAGRLRSDPRWRVHSYDGGHLAMLTTPDQLAETLATVLGLDRSGQLGDDERPTDPGP